jgi:hypothetical protein
VILTPLVIFKVLRVTSWILILYYTNHIIDIDDIVTQERWYIGERAITLVDNWCVSMVLLMSDKRINFISYASVLFLYKLLPAFDRKTSEGTISIGSIGELGVVDRSDRISARYNRFCFTPHAHFILALHQ